MNTWSRTVARTNSRVIAWRFQPLTSSAVSPIAATSAAMFRVLASNNNSTTIRSTIGGKADLMFAAIPFPVTLPMRAQIDCMAPISGKASGMVHSMSKPYWAPACE